MQRSLEAFVPITDTQKAYHGPIGTQGEEPHGGGSSCHHHLLGGCVECGVLPLVHTLDAYLHEELQDHRWWSGGGKDFIPIITSEENKKLQELLESMSSCKTVRQTCDPPSINGPPRQFDDDDRAEKSDVEKLLHVVSTLRNNNRALEERVEELRMAHLDLDDNFRTLHISTNAKMKRLAKAIGQEDLLFPPSP